MGEISIREMRELLSRIEEELARRGELVITRRGKPVARLLPVKGTARRPSHADLRARMPRPVEESVKLLRQDRNSR